MEVNCCSLICLGGGVCTCMCVCVFWCPWLAADDVYLFKISGGHRWIALVILQWENTSSSSSSSYWWKLSEVYKISKQIDQSDLIAYPRLAARQG